VHPAGFFRHVSLALLRNHLESDLFQVAGPGLRIDALLGHARAGGEVRVLIVAGEQIRCDAEAGRHLSPDDIVELGVLKSMRRIGRGCHHAASADDLVARHLRLDEMIVDSG
jgi:hypothetical protein